MGTERVNYLETYLKKLNFCGLSASAGKCSAR